MWSISTVNCELCQAALAAKVITEFVQRFAEESRFPSPNAVTCDARFNWNDSSHFHPFRPFQDKAMIDSFMSLFQNIIFRIVVLLSAKASLLLLQHHVSLRIDSKLP
jgi:hypothetical protein